MEFDIQLTRIDFYHFLMNRSYTRKIRNIARYVGALAVLGSIAVMLKNGLREGIALMLLGIAFAVWTPFILNNQAGKMEKSSKNVSKLHYQMDDTGFTLMPPSEKPKQIYWKDMVGAVYSKQQIVIYKDPSHAYIFPRAQLKDSGVLEALVRAHVKTLERAYVEKVG